MGRQMESSEKEKQGSQSLCIIYPDLNDVFWQGDVVEGQHWESPAHSRVREDLTGKMREMLL